MYRDSHAAVTPLTDTLIQHRIICLPGVLQRAPEQFDPLLPVLRRAGQVLAVDYKGPYFPSEDVQWLVSDLIDQQLYRNGKVTVIGASLGGMQIPWALQKLRRSGVDEDRLRSNFRGIVCDSPLGVRTLAPVPLLLSGVVRRLKWLRLPWQLNKSVGAWVLNKMAVPPRWENIDVPQGVWDVDHYKQWVIDQALKGLSGHELSMFASELVWMAGIGSDEMPVKELHDLDVTYLACTGPNETVRQPAAMELWRPHVKEVVEVPTAHDAFLEQTPLYQDVFNELLGLYR